MPMGRSTNPRLKRRAKLYRFLCKFSSTGFAGCGKSDLFFHSERSEESLCGLDAGKERFLGAKRAFGMTRILTFPQPVHSVRVRCCNAQTPQAEVAHPNP